MCITSQTLVTQSLGLLITGNNLSQLTSGPNTTFCSKSVYIKKIRQALACLEPIVFSYIFQKVTYVVTEAGINGVDLRLTLVIQVMSGVVHVGSHDNGRKWRRNKLEGNVGPTRICPGVFGPTLPTSRIWVSEIEMSIYQNVCENLWKCEWWLLNLSYTVANSTCIRLCVPVNATLLGTIL